MLLLARRAWRLQLWGLQGGWPGEPLWRQVLQRRPLPERGGKLPDGVQGLVQRLGEPQNLRRHWVPQPERRVVLRAPGEFLLR